MISNYVVEWTRGTAKRLTTNGAKDVERYSSKHLLDFMAALCWYAWKDVCVVFATVENGV